MLKNVIFGRFLTKIRMDPRLEFIKESDGIHICSELPSTDIDLLVKIGTA
jgi:hypothetical protein